MISVRKIPVLKPFNKVNDDFLAFGQYYPKYLDGGGANRPPPLENIAQCTFIHLLVKPGNVFRVK